MHYSSDEKLDELVESLQEEFEDKGCEAQRDYGEVTLVVPRAELLDVAVRLRDGKSLEFAQLIDVCGVDYAAYGQTEWATESASSSGFGRGTVRGQAGSGATESGARFAAVYHLLSHRRNLRLRLKVFLEGDPPVVDSVVGIWSSADWFEREAFDLYGILFEGHPDLRRILTDYGFVGHPFRKDFPLIGEVEMRYDPAQQRVVYEPVSIEPRTLVPRVIRGDNRYHKPEVSPTSEESDSADA